LNFCVFYRQQISYRKSIAKLQKKKMANRGSRTTKPPHLARAKKINEQCQPCTFNPGAVVLPTAICDMLCIQHYCLPAAYQKCALSLIVFIARTVSPPPSGKDDDFNDCWLAKKQPKHVHVKQPGNKTYNIRSRCLAAKFGRPESHETRTVENRFQIVRHKPKHPLWYLIILDKHAHVNRFRPSQQKHPHAQNVYIYSQDPNPNVP